MSSQGDGRRPWDADDLARVEPTTISYDVEPAVREPYGSGDAGGVNQYSPIGEVNQSMTFYRRLYERHPVLGAFLVGILLGLVVLVAVSGFLSIFG